MARNADDLNPGGCVALVNTEDDTSVEALCAWIADLEADDDWVDLPVTAADLIADDRSSRAP